MYNNESGNKIIVKLTRDCEAIQIPDGNEMTIEQGHEVCIMQILGGAFTVETEWGYLVRIDGRNADALNQELPEECKALNWENFKSTEETVWAMLKTCYDPEIPVNIVDLGLIYEVVILECNVNVVMTLTAPGCGMSEIICKDIEFKLTQIPNISKVCIDLIFDPPWSQDKMSEMAKFKLGLI